MEIICGSGVGCVKGLEGDDSLSRTTTVAIHFTALPGHDFASGGAFFDHLDV
ncbi:hypothetical protein [Aquamicrobium sp. LC103]|uniref:hypothetical protein n=1 Tax=Aquamicrobium sp. LC103 TaxID=1120658 RepID=UPI00197D1507|nr:hypothetical protein [Aquamicrobium sp. LC103]